VATISKHGRHADGGGLYLSISPNGGRRWVFLFRWHGKPTEIGFGSARNVSLARARELVSQARAKLAEGINPKDARKPSQEKLINYVATHGPLQSFGELLEMTRKFATELHPEGEEPSDKTLRDAIKRHGLAAVGLPPGK
jgi:hypothetical protein